MAQAKQANLRTLWQEASKRYNEDRKRYDEEYRKKHNHFWSRHKNKKHPDGQPPDGQLPELASAQDFKSELAKRQSDFADMRMKNHGVFEAMSALATPVEIIGGQASAIGGLVGRRSPMSCDQCLIFDSLCRLLQ
jgi:hypothetical protein